MKNVVNFLGGFLLGGLLGATLVLLVTPASGDEFRGRVRGEVERVRFEVNKAASDRRIELEQQLAALRKPGNPG
ncbi:MAG: YtxH domain-containing protein [Anaerolineales bacterium]|nr:YtxH domain-containing protein [Anaerolineales bacterium]